MLTTIRLLLFPYLYRWLGFSSHWNCGKLVIRSLLQCSKLCYFKRTACIAETPVRPICSIFPVFAYGEKNVCGWAKWNGESWASVPRPSSITDARAPMEYQTRDLIRSILWLTRKSVRGKPALLYKERRVIQQYSGVIFYNLLSLSSKNTDRRSWKAFAEKLGHPFLSLWLVYFLLTLKAIVYRHNSERLCIWEAHGFLFAYGSILPNITYDIRSQFRRSWSNKKYLRFRRDHSQPRRSPLMASPSWEPLFYRIKSRHRVHIRGLGSYLMILSSGTWFLFPVFLNEINLLRYDISSSSRYTYTFMNSLRYLALRTDILDLENARICLTERYSHTSKGYIHGEKQCRDRRKSVPIDPNGDLHESNLTSKYG